MKASWIAVFLLTATCSLAVAKRLGEGQETLVRSSLEDEVIKVHDATKSNVGDSPAQLPMKRRTVAMVTRSPTPKPTTPCIVPDKKVYECGETITASFNYSAFSPYQAPRIDDRIGIYPAYINKTSFYKAEVWQWGCGAPPMRPKTCRKPRGKGRLTFDKVPPYNNGGQVWPLAPNIQHFVYNGKPADEVNRYFKIVILRNDGEPYTPYCMSNPITVNENSKPGCSIRAEGSISDQIN